MSGVILAPIAAAQDEGGVNFALSPRLYYTFIDTSDYSEVAGVFLGGLSLTAGPASGNWDITINGLDGDGDSDWTELSEAVWSFLDDTGTFEIDRSDYELLWRYRLEDSPVYIGLGLRVVDVEESYIGDTFGLIELDTTELTFGEFAVGFSTQVTEGSRHGMFGNLTIGFGTFDYLAEEVFEPDIEDDGSALLLDANVGYQYVINQSVSFSTRYRVIAVQTSGYETSLDTVHGPELAFTFRF
jgi:hypothetical protein